MQVDKDPFLVNVIEKGERATILIHLVQTNIIIGKNIIIGEPWEVPKVEKISERKVVVERNEGGKTSLQSQLD